MSTIVIAPDSFKGSIDAAAAAKALAQGWSSVVPHDELVELPQADGGEGTCEVIAAAVPGAQWLTTDEPVTGPDGRLTAGKWLQLPNGEAAVELAIPSGLPLMKVKDAAGAQTRGLGQVLRAAVQHGCTRLSIGLGGSASTDGGAGALRELGVKFLRTDGSLIGDGGAALADLARIDASQMVKPPAGGVRLLCDVDSPLTGPKGAAAVFGPQKGALPADVELLDAALAHFADIAGGDRDYAGVGAAGGTAYGFMTLWGAEIVPGAAEVVRLTGLAKHLVNADLVVTGEGSFDASSLAGKCVSAIINAAAENKTPCTVIAGGISSDGEKELGKRGIEHLSLTELSGSVEASIANPEQYLRQAGAQLAKNFHRADKL